MQGLEPEPIQGQGRAQGPGPWARPWPWPGPGPGPFFLPWPLAPALALALAVALAPFFPGPGPALAPALFFGPGPWPLYLALALGPLYEGIGPAPQVWRAEMHTFKWEGINDSPSLQCIMSRRTRAHGKERWTLKPFGPTSNDGPFLCVGLTWQVGPQLKTYWIVEVRVWIQKRMGHLGLCGQGRLRGLAPSRPGWYEP